MQLYFTALFITIAVEFIIYFIFIRKTLFKTLLYAVIINCLTHPLAYLAYTQIVNNYEVNSLFNIYFLIIELIVFLTEIILIKVLFQLSWKWALLISFTANLVTALLSFLI